MLNTCVNSLCLISFGILVELHPCSGSRSLQTRWKVTHWTCSMNLIRSQRVSRLIFLFVVFLRYSIVPFLGLSRTVCKSKFILSRDEGEERWNPILNFDDFILSSYFYHVVSFRVRDFIFHRRTLLMRFESKKHLERTEVILKGYFSVLCGRDREELWLYSYRRVYDVLGVGLLVPKVPTDWSVETDTVHWIR